ncbi:MAG: hypothetical protein RBQ97_01025 [Acholeplasma sp.]|nr:hypothetical protein [Acholeplasma sp.]
MIQVKHIKKVASLFLILVTALLLVACKKGAKVPYGSINKDEVYLSLGEETVTNKELYDSLRKQSTTTLTKLIERQIFSNHLTEVKSLLDTANAAEDSDAEWAQELFDELANTAIFSTNDTDSLRNYKDDMINISVEKFVDTLYTSNNKINRVELANAIKALYANKDDKTNESFATGLYNIDVLRSQFDLDIAKRLYAKSKLEAQYNDEESDDYVEEKEIITYYNSNIKGRHDVQVFYFYFLSQNEANAALREFNLKVDSRGRWYTIPDIRAYTDLLTLTDDAEVREYVKGLLKDLSLTSKFEAGTLTEQDYKKYHDAYSPSKSRDKSQISVPLRVLLTFVDLYNYVNDVQIGIYYEGGTLIDKENIDQDYDLSKVVFKYKVSGDDFTSELTKTYDDLNDLNSSFRSYIYDTITTDQPYSNLRSISNFRYLAFRLGEDTPGIDLVSSEKDDDGNSKWVTIDELKEMVADAEDGAEFTEQVKAAYPDAIKEDGSIDWEKVTTAFEAQKAKWRKEVIAEKLTSTYATTKVSELYEDSVTVEIFDDLIRTFYNQSASIEAKGKAKDGEIVATVKVDLKDSDFAEGEIKLNLEAINIKVDDLFAELTNSVGLSAAMDLALNELLLAQEAKNQTITKDDKKEFEEQFKTLITNFSSGQFESSGYPASLGRETFLLLIFGTTNNDEAIEQGYILPQLRNDYLEDYEGHFDNFYETIQKFTKKQYDNQEGVTVSHLLVYFDENGDGTPDDPNEYFENLTPTEIADLKDLIVELYDKIATEVGTKAGTSTGLTAIAEEFQNSARIDLNDDASLKWQKYRKAGLNLKFEAISSEITNVSNFITGSSTLDTVFYERALYLLDLIITERGEEEEDLVDDGLPYFDFGGNNLNVITKHDILSKDYLNDWYGKDNNVPGVMSSFGFHFILVTGTSEKSSAEYETPSDWETDKDDDDYTFKAEDGTYYTAYNDDSEIISIDQIKYYIKGNKLDGGILVPTAVQTALTKYYEPVITLYSGTQMQSSLLFKLMEANSLDLKGKQAVYDTIKAINKNQFFSYIISSYATESRDARYSDLYADWFTDFGL